MIVTHKIKMDLTNRGAMPQIDAVQGDCNTRMLEVSLLSDGAAWEVPEGTVVRLRYMKPDGTRGSYDTMPDGTRAWSVIGSVVTISLVPRMLTVPGCVLAQVELIQGENSVATFTFRIIVERDPEISCADPGTDETVKLIPIPSEGDNGKYLRVVDGTAVWSEGENPMELTGDLKTLETGDKSSLVAAVNEVAGTVRAAQNYLNRKILFLGDSITQRNTSATGWVGYFNQIIKPSHFVNLAVSGARWCDYEDTVYDGAPVVDGADANHNNTMGNQVEILLRGKDSTHENYAYVGAYDDFDMIFIAAGTNDGDIAAGAEDFESDFVADDGIVPLSSLDKTRFAAAFRYCVETLQTLYPNAVVFICTPVQAYVTTRYFAATKNKRDHLIALCERMSVPYIDTFMCGICGLSEVKGSSGRDLIDGLHPNVAGAKKIARYNAAAVMDYYSALFEESGPTNLLPLAVDMDGNVYNDTGFRNDTGLAITDPYSYTAEAGYVTTGFIPLVNGDVLRSSGTAVMSDDNKSGIFAYDADKNYLWSCRAVSFYKYSLTNVIDTGTGNLQLDTTAGAKKGLNPTVYPVADLAFVRLCMYGTGGGLTVTVNEEIS